MFHLDQNNFFIQIKITSFSSYYCRFVFFGYNFSTKFVCDENKNKNLKLENDQKLNWKWMNLFEINKSETEKFNKTKQDKWWDMTRSERKIWSDKISWFHDDDDDDEDKIFFE